MTGTRLELVWPNKELFLLSPKDEAGKPVWVERDHPSASEVRISDFTGESGDVNEDNPYADNLLFTGDSLDVLRILGEVPEFKRIYRGRIKLIYIDPPFNTGGTFEHYDDWMEHSTWLSFMRDRLLLMKELLSSDGLLFLHLDNFEIHRMRVLLDEVFGQDNYRNTIVWKRTSAKSAARRGLGTMYDNILVYGRGEAAKLNQYLLPYSDEYLQSKYGNKDEKGVYRLGDLTAAGLRNGDSGLPWRGYDPSERGNHWGAPRVEGVTDGENASLNSREKLELLLHAGYIQLPKKEGGAPAFKRYLNAEGGVALGDFWADINVINSQGKERVGYDTQKPEALIERIITLATSPGDIVVDVFAGSGTTAAVAHKMARRWVTADILGNTNRSFAAPRLSRVVEGTDQGGITGSVGWTGGGGFRTAVVGPSMYEVTLFGVLLADWATNGRFARAVAGQLGFEWQTKKHAPFCGIRGRMRLAVLDGAVGEEEVRQIVSALGEQERVTVVAKSVLPGAEELLAALSRGSKIRKAPRDVISPSRTSRKRKDAIR